MPDIAMCSNAKCVCRDLCFRYRAKPSQTQLYCFFEPTTNEQFERFKCEYFVEYIPTKLDRNCMEPIRQCKKCGREMISTSMVVIGYPYDHVKGFEETHCPFCEDIPEQILKLQPGQAIILTPNAKISRAAPR